MEQDIKKVQEWLDNLVSMAWQMRQISYTSCEVENTSISTISMFSQGSACKFSIHIYNGLQKIAELLGLDVTEEIINYKDGRSATQYSVEYTGCTLFQLGTDKKEDDE